MSSVKKNCFCCTPQEVCCLKWLTMKMWLCTEVGWVTIPTPRLLLQDKTTPYQITVCPSMSFVQLKDKPGWKNTKALSVREKATNGWPCEWTGEGLWLLIYPCHLLPISPEQSWQLQQINSRYRQLRKSINYGHTCLTILNDFFLTPWVLLILFILAKGNDAFLCFSVI